MSTDFINEIHSAEERAAQIVRQANIDAKNIISEANKNAYIMIESQDDKMGKSLQEAISSVSVTAEKQKQSIINEAHNQAQAMKMLSLPKMDKASDFIIERIVGIDGNH